MRKYITLFFLGSLFLFACTGNKAPKGILSHDQMISLLTDIHIIDGRMYTLMQNQDSLYKYGTGRFMLLFKQHHTDSLQFRKSMKYYAVNPEELYTMYDQVLANLKVKSDSLNKIQMKPIKPTHAVPHK